MEQHNLKELMDKGVVVTINSDDPAYFGGYLLDNYFETCKALKFGNDRISQLCENSVVASFLPE